MNNQSDVAFWGVKRRHQSGLLLTFGNIVISTIYLAAIFSSGQHLENVDALDIFFEGSSAFAALFMFVVVCFVCVENEIRVPLLLGLILIQLGRATDCLDEVVSFAWVHWSAFGDGLALVGELFTVFAATKWLIRAYKLSVTDRLTQLYNRHHLENVFDKTIRSRRKSDIENTSLIMLDVDNFKRINDCYGHGVGDQVLQSMADLLRDNTRKGDIIARQGGEEFEILLRHTNLNDAMLLAERIRHSFEVYSDSVLPKFTASLGVAMYVPGDDIKSLRRRADTAVYEAKRSGKNKVILADRESKSAKVVDDIISDLTIS